MMIDCLTVVVFAWIAVAAWLSIPTTRRDSPQEGTGIQVRMLVSLCWPWAAYVAFKDRI